MAVTDDQLDALKGWAFELGRDGVMDDPADYDIVLAVLERAESEGLRTEDEFDAILTEDDMPAREDHDDIVAEYDRGDRVRECIFLMLDRARSADEIRDNIDDIRPLHCADKDIDTAIAIIEREPTMRSVNDLTR